ncbi:capsule biosynthesis GfcC family protein [Pseudomonas gregormendelii]|uniref:Capsule biosynthesis GfcC family protein n=2 Tax=Pseudomonas gregormendelii TaxID=1628277 RepID=A0ABS3AJ27_9PSED|nr:capsule biosynthesis GfcC family protein [Pseudomonas gregormendelii]
MILRPSWLLCCSLFMTFTVKADSLVTVQGYASQPGRYSFQEGTRLHDVLLPAQVNPKAYLLGAAWLHTPLRNAQERLKLGVLFDLATVKTNALQDKKTELAALATRLIDKVQAMPVTGRKVAQLDPVRVELNRGDNPYLSNGDVLLYPPRPSTVKVVGAVLGDCELAYQPLEPALSYLKSCPRDPGADADFLLLIQPDGQVFREGIALWNQAKSVPPAPGASIYVPIQSAAIGDPTPDLNTELAAFIATQPLLEVKP